MVKGWLGKKPVWITLSAVFVIIVFAVYYLTSQGVKAEVSAVTMGEIKQVVEDTATVKCAESQTVYVESAGRVADIYFNAGDTVKKGDLLMNMDKSDLDIQLKEAQAGVEAAQAQLRGSEISNYKNQIEIAEASLDQASVAYDSARRDFENARKLFDNGTVSREELDRARDAYRTASAALESARSQLEEAKRGTPDSVKEGYKAQLERAAAARDAIEQSIRKLESRSPMDGVVLEKTVDKNSYVMPGTAAFTVGDTRRLELEANILADDAVKVKVGDIVEISGKAASGASLSGKVSKIAPAAKTIVSSLGINQKRVPVTIELAGDTSLLKPGYNLDIKIITMHKKETLVVPDTAVFDYKGGSCVFALVNSRAVLKPVKKGIEGTDTVEITEGLKAGDIILSKPDNTIKEGIVIRKK